MKSIFYLPLLCSLLHAIPPKQIPKDLYDEFTLGRQIPVSYSYRNDSYASNRPLVYEYEEIEALKKKAMARERNYYGLTDQWLYQALDAYLPFIQGKKVAILGSTVPWYEAIILVYGGFPITIEYNKIISKHPDIKTMTVAQFEAQPEKFDVVLSISSFEHDGLGRYGDPINPRGDLEAMEKTKNMLNPGGILFLAVPVGREVLVWNAHRVYGPKRLPLLLDGWKILSTVGFDESDFNREDPEQPVFILQMAD